MQKGKEWLVVIYLYGFAVSALFFEWRYFVDHGLIKFVVFGWFVPALKALIWPFYVDLALTAGG